MPAPLDPRALRPVGVRAPHGATVLEIEWADGAITRFPHLALRAFCPCASCQGHEGPIRWVPGSEELPRTSLELRSIEQVGNYALALGWGDGHDSGIYTFRYFRELATLEHLSPAEVRGWTSSRG